MSHVRRWALLLAGFALCTLPLWAQHQAEPAEDEEPVVTVVITGERIEQPVSESIATTTIVTAEQMREHGAQTVADVLRQVPGIIVDQQGQPGSLAYVSIRGTTIQQSLILVDGQRVSHSGFLSGTDLGKFPVTTIERIEIIRGPVSSLYGSEAIGGVINIITKQPEDAGGSLDFGFGDNGRATRTIAVHGGTPDLGWELSGSLPAYAGLRPNSEFDGTNITGKLVVPDVNGWKMTLRSESYSDTVGLPGADYAGTGAFDPDDLQDWDRQHYGFSAEGPAGAGQLRWQAYYVRQVLFNEMPGLDWLTGNPTVYTSKVNGKTRVVEATYTFDLPGHQLLFGGEYRTERYEDDEFQDNTLQGTTNKAIHNSALYLQNRWSLTEQTDLLAGARLDSHSSAGSRLTPRLGITHQVTPDAFLRASYGSAFRAPGLMQMYYNAFGMQGNPNLKPETSQQYEVGMNWQRGSDTFDLALFNNRVRDQIAWQGMTYENVTRARQRGLEFAWTRRLNRHTTLTTSYGYLDAINLATRQRILKQPYNRLTMTLATQWHNWDIALSGRALSNRLDFSGQFDPVTFAPLYTKLPGMAVVDLTLTRTYGVVQPYVIVHNLTDVDYQEVNGYQTEGFNIEAGIRTNW